MRWEAVIQDAAKLSLNIFLSHLKQPKTKLKKCVGCKGTHIMNTTYYMFSLYSTFKILMLATMVTDVVQIVF